MNTNTPTRQVIRPALVFALASITTLAAVAQPRPDNNRQQPARNQSPAPAANQPRQLPVAQKKPVHAPTPQRYTEVRHGNDRFYTHRGIFYRPGPGGYVVVRPPIGIVIPALPIGFARIYVNNALYFRFNNIYYRPAPGGYIVVNTPTVVVTAPAPVTNTVVVTTPAPAVVTTTAAVAESNENDYQSLWVNGVEYYFKNGQFFQKTADGLVWVEPLMGAVIQKLPADATSVWYQDIEYHDCDSVYFRKTPDGYKVVEAPWTQS